MELVDLSMLVEIKKPTLSGLFNSSVISLERKASLKVNTFILILIKRIA